MPSAPRLNEDRFNEDHELFRNSLREFIERELAPQVPDWEKQGRIPRSVFKKLGELGYLGINVEEKWGGTANDFFYTVVYLEELARVGCAGLSAAVGVHQFMSTAHIMRVGSEHLKERYLKPAVTGEKWGSLGISEPGAGSDVAAIQCTAVLEGDHYIINGSKTFITNGVNGDFVTLACKTNPSAGASGISLIVVDQGTPGFATSRLKKMGWNSSDTATLFFDNVKVPVSNLIGRENDGFYYIMDSFQLERLVAAIGAVSGAAYALELTLEYMNQREAFGRKLSKFQVLRHRLADLATEIEASRQLTYHACWQYANGIFNVRECTMAKLHSSEVGLKTADVCLQCFGGYGYMEDYPIARLFRDARVGTIVGGTSDIMREILSKIIIDNTSYNTGYKQNKQEISSMENIPQTAREIILSLPDRFQTHKAPDGLNSRFHFDISGDRGGQFTVVLENGHCEVNEGLHGEPKCLIRAKDKNYEAIELGKTNAQMAFMMGKIKISDLSEMMNFIPLFKRLH